MTGVPEASYVPPAPSLRGLGSFVESEREVFFGRDAQRSELAALVTSEGFRAGLFYGEAGTGKTSLLRSALQADLRDQGVLALYCVDNSQPVATFAKSLAEATGHSPHDGEAPIAFLARVIGEGKQQYLFILDDIDLEISSDEQVVAALAELFTRVVSRSAGRARFLFACASDRVHQFAALEKRTGSLFPPTSRYELQRMQAPEAQVVLEQTLAQAGVAAPELATAIIEELSAEGLILPADLQIAALSLNEQAPTSAAEFRQRGGYAELERHWIASAAKATGNERATMRLLGQLAGGSSNRTCLASWLAARASVEPAFALSALSVLQGRGMVSSYPIAGSEELQYSLSHEVLATRVRDQAAPARLSGQHAFDALGSKAAQDKALSPMEYLEIRREGIVPASPQEQAILDRTRLLGKVAVAAALAFPLVILLIAYMMMSGRYYLDTAHGEEGIETIVVRAGKPSMSWFNWLPKSPSFGSIVADTGLTERMVSDKEWRLAKNNDKSGDLDGDSYAKQARSALSPRLTHLVQYALSGEGAALEALHASVQGPDDFVQLLNSLRAVSKGSPEEVQLVNTALKDPSAAVQTAALSLAAAAASRKLTAYDDILIQSLGSEVSEDRRLSFSVVRDLDADIANPLYRAALDQGAGPAASRELQALLTGGSTSSAASVASATSILLSEDISSVTRARAHAMLTRAFDADAAAATEDAKQLIGNEKAKTQDRLLAFSLLLEHAPKASLPGLMPAVGGAKKSKTSKVRAAALPLAARINPETLSIELGTMLENFDSLPPAMQVAAAQAWGQIARMDPGKRDIAKVALERMLKSEKRGLRAAAARAYGYTGRGAQAELAKMIKVEFVDVAESAAYGLANTASSGAPVAIAIDGVRDMWNRKGRLRRISAEVYARLARSRPGPAYFYVSASARATDDPSLHAIGMRGLCNSLRAGNTKVAKDLARAASNSQVDVRRIAIQCVVDNPKHPAISVQVAAAMVDDSNGDIRAESARVLAALAEQGLSTEVVGTALSKMTGDEIREVRLVAIAALASLGSAVPASALEALPAAFDRGDEGEKLVILAAAAKMGATELVQRGIADTSPLVRIAALDTSIATKTGVSAILNSACTDSDTGVRRAALERLSEGKHGLSESDVAQALALAVRDNDPAISDLAMMTNARVGDPREVSEQLARSLQDRSEARRAKAATASLGLVGHSPKLALKLLTPLLSDPSHDVRVAMLEALALAYATTMSSEELAKLMRRSETRANRRIALSAAFLTKAKMKGQREAVQGALEQIAKDGPALAKHDAALALKLLAGSADGLAFLRLLVP